MMDYRARAYEYRRLHTHTTRLNIAQAIKLDAKQARLFSDDIDARGGALSAPCVKPRPGQRDDVLCTISGTAAWY
jgi:hypothetical protein